MTEETFWEEQTQKSLHLVCCRTRWHRRNVGAAPGATSVLRGSWDLPKSLQTPTNAPPGRRCQLCSPASCVRVVHLQPSAPSSPQAFRRPEEHRMLLRHRFPPPHMSKAVLASRPVSSPTAAPDAAPTLQSSGFQSGEICFWRTSPRRRGWLQLLRSQRRQVLGSSQTERSRRPRS